MVIGIKLEGDVLNWFQVILLLMTPRHRFQSRCIKPAQLRLLALLHVRASLLCFVPLSAFISPGLSVPQPPISKVQLVEKTDQCRVLFSDQLVTITVFLRPGRV